VTNIFSLGNVALKAHNIFSPLVCGQEVMTSYAGQGTTYKHEQMITKRALRKRRNTQTTSRIIELYHLDKWTMPLIEAQELYSFNKFQTKIKLEIE
jgi:hypothetical protein